MLNAFFEGAIAIAAKEQGFRIFADLVVDRGKQRFHIIKMTEEGANTDACKVRNLLCRGNEGALLHQREGRVDNRLLATFAASATTVQHIFIRFLHGVLFLSVLEAILALFVPHCTR